MSTSISLFHFRAGSPVVKAGDFHRGSRSLNLPEIFKNFFFYSVIMRPHLWFEKVFIIQNQLKIIIEQLNIIYGLGHAHSDRFVRLKFSCSLKREKKLL